MRFKDKIFVFPFFVVFFIDLTVLVFFAAYLASGEFQWTKILYLFLVTFISIAIYFLRTGLIGKNTVLDKFTNDEYFGRGLIGFVSLVLGTLMITLLIVKTELGIFINDFQKLDFEPLKWFEFLNSNYQQIILYTFLLVVICYIVLSLIALTSRFVEERAVIKIAITFGIIIIFILFTSKNLLNIWHLVFDIKIVQQVLTYLFSGSLIYFNLFFLLKRPSA